MTGQPGRKATAGRALCGGGWGWAAPLAPGAPRAGGGAGGRAREGCAAEAASVGYGAGGPRRGGAGGGE